MKSRLCLTLCLFAVSCGKQPDVKVNTCTNTYEWIEESVSTSARSAPGNKVAQNIYVSNSMIITKVMLRAITNGLSAVRVQIYKGEPGNSPETGSPIVDFDVTTGLDKTNASDENWFALPTPLSIYISADSMVNASNLYSLVFTSTGGNWVVDYGGIGSGRFLRNRYFEFSSGTWGGGGGDTLNGLSIGLAGTLDCNQ